jgi:hypothetical protein
VAGQDPGAWTPPPRRIDAVMTRGSRRQGIWCDPCALPSVVEADVVLLTGEGVERIGHHRSCYSCRTRTAYLADGTEVS